MTPSPTAWERAGVRADAGSERPSTDPEERSGRATALSPNPSPTPWARGDSSATQSSLDAFQKACDTPGSASSASITASSSSGTTAVANNTASISESV